MWTLIETLYHSTSIINVLEHHKAMYDHARMHAQSEDLDIIFDHMNVQHFGHTVAYLTLVYTVKERKMSHVEPCVWFSHL